MLGAYEMKPRWRHQYSASSWLHSSRMSDNIIPPEQAGLLLHRFVTERVPIMAWFVSSDGSVEAKLTGFVAGFTQSDGLHIVSELAPPGDPPPPAFMTFKVISGSVSRYTDDSEVPPDFVFGSGLRLNLPNRDTLTILEIREKVPFD